MATVLATPDSPTDRNDYRHWDRIGGYVDGVCIGCTLPALLFHGVCQPCWEGVDQADEVQRALDEALRAIRKASDLLGAVKDRDRLGGIYSQSADAQAAASNLRLAAIKAWRKA